MAFITLAEIIDIIIMTLVIGFIASRFFRRKPKENYDPLTYFKKNSLWEDIKYGIMIAAPAVVLHELAHKFVAMSFGASATLHAPITMYLIVLFLIFINFPIIFFVGGYVSIIGTLTPLQRALTSFAGPGTNLLLWGLFSFALKTDLGRKYHDELSIMVKINMFLFIFNMIPFPGFDGFNFFRALSRC
jgi:Zn-dependent protease